MVEKYVKEMEIQGFNDSHFDYKANSSNHAQYRQIPMECPNCTRTFKNAKLFIMHLTYTHFLERLGKDLPHLDPFLCPIVDCNSTFKKLEVLIRHYGINHNMTIKLLNEDAGIMDSYDSAILKKYEKPDYESWNQTRCPLCKSSINDGKLIEHILYRHFKERLMKDLTQTNNGLIKCPKCNHKSEDWKEVIKHYGIEHKMVRTWLQQMNIPG